MAKVGGWMDWVPFAVLINLIQFKCTAGPFDRKEVANIRVSLTANKETAEKTGFGASTKLGQPHISMSLQP